MGRFPSGQREQTVNLPSQTSVVRIHPHPPTHAGMAELADALDSGSSEGFLHAGSSPVSRTKTRTKIRPVFLLFVQYAERLSTPLSKYIRIYSPERTFFRPKKPTHDTTHDTENGKSSSKTMSQRFNISVFAAEIRCCENFFCSLVCFRRLSYNVDAELSLIHISEPTRH